MTCTVLLLILCILYSVSTSTASPTPTPSSNRRRFIPPRIPSKQVTKITPSPVFLPERKTVVESEVVNVLGVPDLAKLISQYDGELHIVKANELFHKGLVNRHTRRHNRFETEQIKVVEGTRIELGTSADVWGNHRMGNPYMQVHLYVYIPSTSVLDDKAMAKIKLEVLSGHKSIQTLGYRKIGSNERRRVYKLPSLMSETEDDKTTFELVLPTLEQVEKGTQMYIVFIEYVFVSREEMPEHMPYGNLQG